MTSYDPAKEIIDSLERAMCAANWTNKPPEDRKVMQTLPHDASFDKFPLSIQTLANDLIGPISGICSSWQFLPPGGPATIRTGLNKFRTEHGDKLHYPRVAVEAALAAIRE